MNTPHRTPHPGDPHAGQPLLTAGPRPEDAPATLILVHGRGALAQSMLSICTALELAPLAAIAPQAAGRTWYPQTFLAPLPANQPYLNSALSRLETVVEDLIQRGIPAGRIALLGFSQGGCLATEYVARHPRRYGAVMGLSGGLIGPPGTTWQYPGSLAGTPVLLASGDPDPHVPFERVRQTEAVLARMEASVDLRHCPGMPHTITDEELVACRTLLAPLLAQPRTPQQ